MQLNEICDLLLARAAELGIRGDTDEATLDRLLEREVQAAPVTEADCRRQYEEQRDQFRAGDLAEADHILFAVTDAVPLEALRARALEALGTLRTEPQRFAQTAQQLSNCPSGAVGGSLGQLARDAVVPEFWRALEVAGRAGATGVLPELVETRYGLHIVRLARYVEGRALPYEAVRDRIEQALATRRLHEALRDYAHALAHADGEHAHGHPQDHGHAAPARAGAPAH
jgi:peptidyl-prolyl cis-trans isomerase C